MDYDEGVEDIPSAIPTLPDSKRPRLSRIQQRMQGLSPVGVKDNLGDDDLFPPVGIIDPRSGPPPIDAPGVRGRSATLSSRNWSGAVTLATSGERLGFVAGSWVVPQVIAPDPMGTVVTSMWIGFDGHRRHAGSMPQVGVVFGWDKGTKFVRAWHQWWVRDKSFPPRVIKSLPVGEGDRIAAWMRRHDDGSAVDIHLARIGKSISTTIFVAYTLKAPVSDRPVLGKSAQWIVERTKKMKEAKLYPLARFATASFDEWAAGGSSPSSSEDRLITSVRLYAADETPGDRRTRMRIARSDSAPGSSDRLRRRGTAPITLTYEA